MNYEFGYDYDGVVSEGVAPVRGNSVIITGNGKESKDEIEAKLKEVGAPGTPIEFYDGEDKSDQAIGSFKAGKIKELGVRTFFEDTPAQIEVIKKENPGVKVILVEGGSKKFHKYIFFSYEMYCGPIALKLIEEGNQVEFVQIEDKEDTLLEEEKKDGGGDEEPEFKKRRLSIYDGFFKKIPARKAMKVLGELEDKSSYFLMTDINNSFKFMTQALEMGFENGFFPKEEDRKLEVARDEGKKIVQEHYKDIKVKEYKEFKTAEEGIQYLEDNQNIYVLKSLGDSGETVVPKNDDPELANKVIIDALTRERESYEQNGYLLEQKIMDAVEITPQIVFWNGQPVFTNVDIETKTRDAGEVGVNVGCGFNLVVRTDLEDKLNKMAFPEYVYEMAKERRGLFVWDVGILIDKKDGKMYFTEFCPNRVGWDAFPTEIAMSGDREGNFIASPYFDAVAQGKNPLRVRFGAAVRVFNENEDGKRYPQEGLSVSYDDDAKPDIYLYDVKQKDGIIITAGYQRDLGTVTGVGDTLDEAIERVYKYVHMVNVKDMGYRCEDDFRSRTYPQAIFNRLQYLIDKKLIKDDGISQSIKKLGYGHERDAD